MLNVRLAAAIMALVSLAPTIAAAQSWPSRSIHFIVPYPAGGSTDIGARAIADHLSRVFGQQVVVENKSGGSGNVGFDFAAKSAPDGYTVLIAPDQVTSAPHVFKVSFDPLKDFVPVIQLSKQHMTAAWFAKLAGIQLEHVPYRGGGQAINDLVAGHINLASLGSSPLIPHYKAGTLKLLAQSMAERSPSLPDIPTYKEAGVALALDQWLGALVPAGTPPAIVARLNAEMNKALAAPAV